VHQFIDFKSFEDARLDTFRPLTLLIGKNGSGKSNVIEAMELLAEIAHGRPLYEMTDIGRGGRSFEVRGGLSACPRGGRATFSLTFVSNLWFEGSYQPSLYQVTVRPLPEPRIEHEVLSVAGRTLFDARLPPGTAILLVRYESFTKRRRPPEESLPADRSVLSRYEQLASRSPRLRPVLASVDTLRKYLRAAFAFDPQPKTMRAYERVGNRILSREGSNLSAVLYALQQGTDAERAALLRILEKIRQVPEEPLQDFAFVTTSLNDVLFGFRERPEGPILDARLLSDGTLRCLAVLTALETVAENSRVVIEEFDNGLHPSRVRVLTQAISDACLRRKLNVVCTTHNPATLNGLSTEEMKGVVLCFWERGTGASRLMPLLQLPRADVLLERGQLGDLVTRRVLEQHLLPNFEERQKAKAKEWLDSLP